MAVKLCVMVNGKAILTKVDTQGHTDVSAGPQVLELTDSIKITDKSYSTVEITPPQPFFKGTLLQADVEQLTLTPVSDSH